MPDTYVVAVNLLKLQQRLSKAEPDITPAQMMDRLQIAGLTRQPDGTWLADDVSLEVLDRTEYLTLQRV